MGERSNLFFLYLFPEQNYYLFGRFCKRLLDSCTTSHFLFIIDFFQTAGSTLSLTSQVLNNYQYISLLFCYNYQNNNLLIASDEHILKLSILGQLIEFTLSRFVSWFSMFNFSISSFSLFSLFVYEQRMDDNRGGYFAVLKSKV